MKLVDPSAESLLISAMLNTADATSPASYGISPSHFRGYADEYNWILNHTKHYGEAPSKDEFMLAFRGFLHSDHDNVRSACDLMLDDYYKAKASEALIAATDHLALGDLNSAVQVMQQIRPKRTSARPTSLIKDMSFLDTYFEEQRAGVDTPYPSLTKATGGLRAGNLWYLAARPAQGKSSHTVNFAVHAMKQGCRVKYYSLEMSEMEMRGKLHAQLATEMGYAGITSTAIRERNVDREQYKLFLEQMESAYEGDVEVHTPKDGLVTPSTIASDIEDYDLLVIDLITLMRNNAGDQAIKDWRIAAEISNDLKQIALAGTTPVLGTVQINREGDQGDKPAKLRNLAQSDSLAQDGDVVITMRAKPHNVATHFSLEKNRHGVSGIDFYSEFKPNSGKFREISEQTAEALVLNAEDY